MFDFFKIGKSFKIKKLVEIGERPGLTRYDKCCDPKSYPGDLRLRCPNPGTVDLQRFRGAIPKNTSRQFRPKFQKNVIFGMGRDVVFGMLKFQVPVIDGGVSNYYKSITKLKQTRHK